MKDLVLRFIKIREHRINNCEIPIIDKSNKSLMNHNPTTTIKIQAKIYCQWKTSHDRIIKKAWIIKILSRPHSKSSKSIGLTIHSKTASTLDKIYKVKANFKIEFIAKLLKVSLKNLFQATLENGIRNGAMPIRVLKFMFTNSSLITVNSLLKK